SDVKWPRDDRETQRIQSRMEYSQLKRSRRQVIEDELAQGIGLGRCLQPIDHDRRGGEKAAVQAVDDDPEDLRLPGFRASRRIWRGRVLGVLGVLGAHRSKGEKKNRGAELKTHRGKRKAGEASYDDRLGAVSGAAHGCEL